MTADGQSIITVRAGRHEGKHVSIWDATTGELSQSRTLPVDNRGHPLLAVLSPHGQWLATSNDREPGVELWDPRAAKKKHTFLVPDGRAYSHVVFSADGKRLAAVCTLHNRRSVHVWEMDAGREVWHKTFDTLGAIRDVTFGPDGTRLLVSFASSVGGASSCWDLTTGKRLWQNKELEPYCVVVTPGGRIIAQEGRKMKTLDLATGQPVPSEKQCPVTDLPSERGGSRRFVTSSACKTNSRRPAYRGTMG